MRVMRGRIVFFWCLLAAFAPSGAADAEISPNTAALLASWPDGASGNVAINEVGSDRPEAFYVARQGTRLTIFDRTERRYKTYYLSRTGAVLLVWDPTTAQRTRYVIRGGGRSLRLLEQPGAETRAFGVRSSGAERRGAPVVPARPPARSRMMSAARTLRYRIRTLDQTLSDFRSSRSAIEAAVVSIVVDP